MFFFFFLNNAYIFYLSSRNSMPIFFSPKMVYYIYIYIFTHTHKLFQTGNMTRSLCVFYIIIYEKKFEEDVFIILFIAIKPSRCLRAESVHKSTGVQNY